MAEILHKIVVPSLSPVAGPFSPVAFLLSSEVQDLQQLTLCMHLVVNTFVLSTNRKCTHVLSLEQSFMQENRFLL